MHIGISKTILSSCFDIFNVPAFLEANKCRTVYNPIPLWFSLVEKPSVSKSDISTLSKYVLLILIVPCNSTTSISEFSLEALTAFAKTGSIVDKI